MQYILPYLTIHQHITVTSVNIFGFVHKNPKNIFQMRLYGTLQNSLYISLKIAHCQNITVGPNEWYFYSAGENLDISTSSLLFSQKALPM